MKHVPFPLSDYTEINTAVMDMYEAWLVENVSERGSEWAWSIIVAGINFANDSDATAFMLHFKV